MDTTAAPGSLTRYGRGESTEAHESEVEMRREKGSKEDETRSSSGRPGPSITAAALSPAQHRTWPDRPKSRAHCTELPLGTHGAHGPRRDRQDSSRSSLPSPLATNRPAPQILQQSRYCAIQHDASSASPRCHFYTRSPISCLLTDAHGCYNRPRDYLGADVDRFRSRSMLGLVLCEEFVDTPSEDVVHDHARNGDQQPRRRGFEREAQADHDR